MPSLAAQARSATRARTFALSLMTAAALGALSLAPAGAATAASADSADAEIMKKECGACHYPYARDWLPAYSWKQILEHLDNHFGENATLNDKTRQRIETYMIGGRSPDMPLRITESDWWLDAHGGDSIKTYAKENGFKVSSCEMCHR